MEALGPPAFNFCGKRFTRTDFCLQTKRGYNLECSHWEPVERATDRIPVVIYMHGNSSARIEVLPQLSYLLSLGLAVFAFDFAGSGKSDGDYVSLGFYEREDLSCIVAHLRATNVVSTIALWGRSMGAATALMFGDRDPSIACMILDSSFCDLTQLCEEMCEKGREQGIVVPGFVVSVALKMIQMSVKKQAGFNIKHISPLSHSDKCFIPALFVAGEHDDFIKKHHSEALHAKYAGDKNIIIVEGDHNSPRPKFMFDSASIFLQTCLQIPPQWTLQVPVSMNLMCPPWYFEIYQQRAARRRQQQQARQQQPQRLPVTAYNPDEVGMTAERQRAIQASLFKMLGQADDAADEKKSNQPTPTKFAAPPKPESKLREVRVEVGVPAEAPKTATSTSTPTAGATEELLEPSEPSVEVGVPVDMGVPVVLSVPVVMSAPVDMGVPVDIGVPVATKATTPAQASTTSTETATTSPVSTEATES
jgi:pimeloyl-ACP methyl ester carboxylesterase